MSPKQAPNQSLARANGAATSLSDELQEVVVTAKRLDVNPENLIRSGSNPSPDAVRDLQEAIAREEQANATLWTLPDIMLGEPSYGPLASNNGVVRTYAVPDLWPTVGMADLSSPAMSGDAEVFGGARASMRDYWTGLQDRAVASNSFLGYAGAGIMRTLGDVGYGAAETTVAMYRDPGSTLHGVGQAVVNFGPESFNALTNLTKTSLNGLTMLAEATIAPQGTFAGFRDSDPYNIELLAPYSNRAEAGGAFLANVGLGVGLAKYGNVPLQSPVYVDLQQGAVAYSGVPLGVRSPFITEGTQAASNGVWQLDPFQRGKAIEKSMGHNLPSNFPTIDKFENGLATSIKSIDLNAVTYQNPVALSRTINGYVDSVAGFNGRTWAGARIRSQDITGRALDLVVPNSGTAAQQAAINQAIQNAASRNVILNVIKYP